MTPTEATSSFVENSINGNNWNTPTGRAQSARAYGCIVDACIVDAWKYTIILYDALGNRRDIPLTNPKSVYDVVDNWIKTPSNFK